MFTACFGRLDGYPWSPLSNAVYWEERPHPDADYALDPCRIYRCRGGHWQEERYENLYFARTSSRACSTRRTACCANT